MIFTSYPFDDREERRRNLPDRLQRMIGVSLVSVLVDLSEG